jgi:hypothetical protein
VTCTGSAGRSGSVEQGRRLFTWNMWCKRTVARSLNLQMCLSMCSSIVKGPSCMSFSFMFVCARRKGFVVTTDTLSPLTKCGVVDHYVRACISSLCRYNTERIKPLARHLAS